MKIVLCNVSGWYDIWTRPVEDIFVERIRSLCISTINIKNIHGYEWIFVIQNARTDNDMTRVVDSLVGNLYIMEQDWGLLKEYVLSYIQRCDGELLYRWLDNHKLDGIFNKLLKVVEIPDDIEYEIIVVDGWEEVHEKHRSWK